VKYILHTTVQKFGVSDIDSNIVSAQILPTSCTRGLNMYQM